MWGPSSVSIDDDLSTSESGIGLWSSLNERFGRVHDVFGIDQVFLWDDLLDNLLDDGLLNFFLWDSGIVLSGDQHVVASDWDIALKLVLHGDLSLAIRSKPWDRSVLSLLHELVNEFVGVVVRKRVEV